MFKKNINFDFFSFILSFLYKQKDKISEGYTNDLEVKDGQKKVRHRYKYGLKYGNIILMTIRIPRRKGKL